MLCTEGCTWPHRPLIPPGARGPFRTQNHRQSKPRSNDSTDGFDLTMSPRVLLHHPWNPLGKSAKIHVMMKNHLETPCLAVAQLRHMPKLSPLPPRCPPSHELHPPLAPECGRNSVAPNTSTWEVNLVKYLKYSKIKRQTYQSITPLVASIYCTCNVSEQHGATQ